MTDENETFNLPEFEARLASAAGALQAFARGPAQQAADSVSASFERAGDRITRALGQAAVNGEGAFRRLAQTVLEEFARLAIERLFASGRSSPAAQKTVAFPTASGAAKAAPPLAVHIHLGANTDVSTISRHQGQIAAAVARAVAYGSRNL